MMEPSPYKTDFERQRQFLIDRYMRLRPNYLYDSSEDRFQWVEEAAKNRYRPEVKINNWLEEQNDVDYLKHRRPLSDYDYVYRTEYIFRYGDLKGGKILPKRKEPRCFPGHQPELDLPRLKQIYNSFETTSRVAYQDPGVVTTKQEESPCIYCRIHAGHIRR